MDHKKLSVEAFEEILKFMDRSANQYKDKSKEKSDLDEKLVYLNKSNEIEKARRVLLSLCFELEDYAKTGEFEPSIIIVQEKCLKCGK